MQAHSTSRFFHKRRWAPHGAVLLAGGLLLAGCSSDTSAHGQSHGDGVDAPADLVTGVSGADVMFAQMMIPHHEQAVVMSALAESRASDPLIRDLAKEISGAQEPEIALMASWLDEWGAERLASDQAMGAHGSHGMAGMLTQEQLDELAAAQGSEFDALFAQSMIEHHEGAVQMARDVLASGSDPDVASLAREIIVTQEKEILQLTSYLADSGSAGAGIAITPALGHVHGVIVDGGDLVVGTHDGVHRISLPTGVSSRVGSSQDDLMGFAGEASGSLVASGHPGPGSSLPNPLGLVISEDGGQSWRPTSLQGEVDFHGLAVRGDEIVGWDTRGPLQWSTDGGVTWTPGPALTPTSLAWFGDDVWLATPDLGLVTWRPGAADVVVRDVPGLLVAVSPDGRALWRMDDDGVVHRTRDGITWEERGQVTSVEALAGDAERAYAVTARSVQIVS
jgi:uncharacterized protein (DUF305 family)